jgi:galactose mutarotase-like enzyme
VYVEWEVTNPSKDEPLYFSIGAHPAFNVPVLAGTKKDDYYVVFEGKDTLKYIYLDPVAEAADAEHPHTLELDNGFMPVTMDLFDNDAFIFDGGQVEKVAIHYPDKTPYVTIECKGFPSVGVWSKPKTDAPYICLEPWIGRVDNKGFTGELPEKFEEQCAMPGETFKAVYSITVD